MTEEKMIRVVNKFCDSMEKVGDRIEYRERYENVDRFSYILGYTDAMKEAYKILKEEGEIVCKSK